MRETEKYFDVFGELKPRVFLDLQKKGKNEIRIIRKEHELNFCIIYEKS